MTAQTQTAETPPAKTPPAGSNGQEAAETTSSIEATAKSLGWNPDPDAPLPHGREWQPADKFVESRIAKIVGEEGGQEIHFSGADITSDDVRVSIDEQFPNSRAAKLEFALELVKAGVLSAKSARKILSVDSMTSVDDIIVDAESERIAAEQAAMAARPMVPPGTVAPPEMPGMPEGMPPEGMGPMAPPMGA